jgi:hypothetical protein
MGSLHCAIDILIMVTRFPIREAVFGFFVIFVAVAIVLRLNRSSDASEPMHIQSKRILHDSRDPTGSEGRVLDASAYDFNKAKSLASTLLNLIYNRYEMYDEPGSQFFLTANNYGSFHWDIIKYKYASKILQGNSSFLMIFGGSSVTAGKPLTRS